MRCLVLAADIQLRSVFSFCFLALVVEIEKINGASGLW